MRHTFWQKYIFNIDPYKFTNEKNESLKKATLFHCIKKCPYSELFCSAFSGIRTRITPNTSTFYEVFIAFHKPPRSLFTRKNSHWSPFLIKLQTVSKTLILKNICEWLLLFFTYIYMYCWL